MLEWISNHHSSWFLIVRLGDSLEGYPSVSVDEPLIFYKYYIGKQQPKPSDFGDMFQLYDLPYCKLVIIEKNMCEFLRQIKKNHDVLDGVTIMSKDQLKDWEWVEEK